MVIKMPIFGAYYNKELQQTFKTKKQAEAYVRKAKQDPNADGRKFAIKKM